MKLRFLKLMLLLFILLADAGGRTGRGLVSNWLHCLE